MVDAETLEITAHQPEIWPLSDRNDVIALRRGFYQADLKALATQRLFRENHPPQTFISVIVSTHRRRAA